MGTVPTVTVTTTPPVGRMARIRGALTRGEWFRVGGMAITVVGLNVLGWAMLVAAVRGHYHITKTEVFGFGTGVLAYTLGMRHAFDADHIAAIDNTTRKLIQDGERPLSVGYFFSLGHSTIVFLLAVLLNFGIRRSMAPSRMTAARCTTGAVSSGRRSPAPSCGSSVCSTWWCSGRSSR